MATYQTFVPADNSTGAHMQTWGQAFGQAMLNFGWVAQTGHGEVVASNVSGTWTWTNTPTPPTSGTVIARLVPNFRGAWNSGTPYVGSASANGLADVVTNGGLTWICISNNVSPFTTAPGSDLTHWQPYNFEIFKSNGSNTSTLPIFIKLVYTNNNGGVPALQVQVGTAVDSNGNVINGPAYQAAPGNLAALFISSTSGTTVTGSTCEMDFSGDADNFRMLVWRNYTTLVGGSSCPICLVVERAKNSSGSDIDAYFWVGFLGTVTAGNATVCGSGIVFKSSLGGAATQSTSNWPGAVAANTATQNVLGASPALPIFPLVGYVANPLLGVVSVNPTDYATGSLIPVWMYGAIHTYLVGFSDSGVSNMKTSIGGAGVPAIRWE